ncbi:interferon-inducible GTPase-domain-containing protein, partial [Pisolithus marmoratus]
TTCVFDKHPKPNLQYLLVWYDIPGAGMLGIPGWQYFDAVDLIDNLFTMTDEAEASARRQAEADAREEAETHAHEEAEARAREEEAHARQEAETRAREEAEARAREEEARARQTRAREEAEARAREQEERAERILQEMEEQRRRQEAEAAAVREEEARRRNALEEETRRATRAQEEAEQTVREAAEAAIRALAAREEIERQLIIGTQPVVVPTPEEIRLARERVQYDDAVSHIAIAGIAGSGKPSLINALRGLNNNDRNAAPTGVNETTLEISRYVDAHNPQLAWYDIPGSGTARTPDWQYFHSQGLYVFDCILVLINDRFTTTDLAILTNCHHFRIPTFIVRSKSDQHISNLMMDMGYDPDEEDTDRQAQFRQVARDQYISETRQNVENNLAEANLPDQRVYIVSKWTLLAAVKDQGPRGTVIDEIELLTNLYNVAFSRL